MFVDSTERYGDISRGGCQRSSTFDLLAFARRVHRLPQIAGDTLFGRYVYTIGSNCEAAEYSGVNVKIVGAVMVIAAVCSGIAGMLGVAYFDSAQQNEFTTSLLDVAARFLGPA